MSLSFIGPCVIHQQELSQLSRKYLQNPFTSLHLHCHHLSPNHHHFSVSFPAVKSPTSLSANPFKKKNTNLTSWPLPPLKYLKGPFKIKTILTKVTRLPFTYQFNQSTFLFTPCILAKMPFFQFLPCSFLQQGLCTGCSLCLGLTSSLLCLVTPLHFLGHNHHFLRQDFVDSATPGPIPPNPLATPNPILTQLPAFFLPVPGSELPSVAGESHWGVLPPSHAPSRKSCQDRNKDADVESGLEDTGIGRGKLGRDERVSWTYIHYQM